MDKITFIYCFRDREIYRVKLSLDSLANQTDLSFRVIFVDYGSDKDFAGEVEKLVISYSFAQYIYNDTRGMVWNRSHALNTAIQLAETEFIFTSDIDMIYKPGFVAMLNQMVQASNAYFFSAIYLPEGALPGKKENDSNFAKSNNDALGWGLIPKITLKELNGYDEVYCIWGKEDNDIGDRIKKSGVKFNYVTDIWMYHYYHPPVPYQREILPEDWFLFLSNYFDHNKSELFRNKNHEWGKILKTEDRTALTLQQSSPDGFETINCRCRYFRYLLETKLDQAISGDSLKYIVEDTISNEYHQSPLFRFAGFINSVFKKLRIPFSIHSVYENRFEDIYFFRNELMFLLITRKNIIKDYAYRIDGKKMNVVIVKK